MRHWKDMYKIQEQFAGTALPENNQDENRPSAANTYDVKIETEQQTAFLKEEFTPSYTQINLSYIVVSTKTGFLLVDQQLAHQRILYERFEQVTSTPISIQKCLLPQTFELPPSDAILLLGMLPDLLELGYEVEEMKSHRSRKFLKRLNMLRLMCDLINVNDLYERSLCNELFNMVKNYPNVKWNDLCRIYLFANSPNFHLPEKRYLPNFLHTISTC